MLSQYTWWDFIKVVGTGLVIYYAYVAWAYYREDIREWISNRGQPEQSAPAQADEAEEESDDSSLYSVSSYTEDTTPAPAEAINEEPDPVAESDEEEAESEPVPEPVTAQANPDDSQAIVAEEVIPGSEADLVFEMTIQIEPIKPAERSLGAVVRSAQSLQVDEQGRLLADEDATADTKELADTLNEQKGFGSVLSGINFNR